MRELNGQRGIFNEGAGWAAELRTSGDEPQEAVGIQKQIHCMYSVKSGRGASKSSATTTKPAALPNWAWRLAGVIAISCTTGWAFFAMEKGLSFIQCDLASHNTHSLRLKYTPMSKLGLPLARPGDWHCRYNMDTVTRVH